jgi:hypothetical protein
VPNTVGILAGLAGDAFNGILVAPAPGVKPLCSRISINVPIVEVPAKCCDGSVGNCGL